MKAVVVEIKGKYAAILKDDGSVIRDKNKNYMIGDVVDMKEINAQRKMKAGAWIAVAAMLVMMFSVGVFAYATPYYYVSLDVNPGIILEVNLFERVIGMEAANDEAAQILEELDLKNKDITDAIAEAVERIAQTGYLDEESSNIVIAATSKNEGKSEKLAEKLGAAALKEANGNNSYPDVKFEAIGYELVMQAKSEGITPGKLNIILNLLGEQANDINKNESISELMSRFTADKGDMGRAIAAEVSGGRMNTREAQDLDNEPAENSNLAEQNAQRKAEEAKKQEGNAPSEIPAASNKAPNAEKMEDNTVDSIPDELPDTSKPDEIPAKPDVPQIPDELPDEAPEAPEIPEIPETPEKPDVPAGGRP